MSAKLTDLWFQVTSVLNPTRRKLNLAIADFTAKLKRDDLVFLHFSGHGVEIDGDNILLPADVPKPKSGRKYALVSGGIGLRRLVDLVSRTGARTRVFIIDACRDNPFEKSGVRSIGSSRNLTRIEASVGTFIMYSEGYRQTALDRLGPNDNEPTSVYTRVLLSKLGATGKSLASVGRDVRKEARDLANGVGHEQRPAYYDELCSALILKKDPNHIVMGNPVRPTDAGASPEQAKPGTSQESGPHLPTNTLDWNPSGTLKQSRAQCQNTKPLLKLAPRAGLEPATKRLTAACSTN